MDIFYGILPAPVGDDPGRWLNHFDPQRSAERVRETVRYAKEDGIVRLQSLGRTALCLTHATVLAKNLKTGLAALSADLRAGNIAPNTSRRSNVTNDIRQQSAYLQRMQTVIRELRSAISLSR